MNHLALDILIAILIKNEEARGLENLFLPFTAMLFSPVELDDNETALLELHIESGGKMQLLCTDNDSTANYISGAAEELNGINVQFFRLNMKFMRVVSQKLCWHYHI